jgi:hypothetical protein
VITRTTRMTPYVSLYAPPCYKQLFLMIARYVHYMENCWFHYGWMETLTMHSWKHYTHINHCIYYIKTYKEFLEECLQMELALQLTHCLLTSTSVDANNSYWWCILPNQILNLSSLCENWGHLSVLHHERIYKMRVTCPNCAYYVWHT